MNERAKTTGRLRTETHPPAPTFATLSAALNKKNRFSPEVTFVFYRDLDSVAANLLDSGRRFYRIIYAIRRVVQIMRNEARCRRQSAHGRLIAGNPRTDTIGANLPKLPGLRAPLP